MGIRGWFIRKDHQQADNKKRKAIARIQKWYNMVRKEIAAAEKGKKAAAEKKKREEREAKAREKAESKAKKALEARLTREKAEREARIAREKEEEEEREKKEREKEAKNLKKRQDALNKFEKSKEKKIKKFKKEVKSKEKELDDKEKRWTPEINELEEKCEKAEQERDDILEQIANEEAKLAAIPQLSDKDKKKLSESSEIITYVRKENKKRLLEANAYAGASFEAMNEQSKKTNSNNSKLMQNLNKYKKQNVKLKEDLRMRSGYYDAEAQIRVNYQKSMAEIMEMIQDQCDDAQLTEDILVLALECESEAKSELASAEAEKNGY